MHQGEFLKKTVNMAESPDIQGVVQQPQSEPKARILLVDDIPANLLALRALLDPLDQSLVEAHSGQDALRCLESDDFAVVLLDVLMPGISGFETAKLIRGKERSRHTPIIFLTANDIDGPQMEEGYLLGAVDFLVKPVMAVALLAKVRGFVQLFQDKQRTRREAKQLRLLVEGAEDYAIFMLDPLGNVSSWNPGAERIKGYNAAEIIGQHFSKFYPQDAIDRGWPSHELKVAKEEGRFEDEGWRVRKDGTRFWANVVITALYDEAGHFVGYSKITRDLTERKKAEENARRLVKETTARRVAEENARHIQEQRERLRVTLASIGDAVIATNPEGRVTIMNPVAECLTGWKNDEATGQPLESVFKIVNEETRISVENPALRALREGVIMALANHTILIARDGTERPIDDSAAPIRFEHGEIAGSVLVFRLTRGVFGRPARQFLRHAVQKRHISPSVGGDHPIANAGKCHAQPFLLLSKALLVLPSFTDVTLETVFVILNEQTRQPVENPVEKVLRDGATVSLGNHTLLIAKDGTERPIDDSAAPIRDATGVLIGVVVTFRDVTEQRQSEARKSAILETALDCIITMDREGARWLSLTRQQNRPSATAGIKSSVKNFASSLFRHRYEIVTERAWRTTSLPVKARLWASASNSRLCEPMERSSPSNLPSPVFRRKAHHCSRLTCGTSPRKSGQSNTAIFGWR